MSISALFLKQIQVSLQLLVWVKCYNRQIDQSYKGKTSDLGSFIPPLLLGLKVTSDNKQTSMLHASAHLVWGQNLEGGHDLFCSVGLGGLAGHEVDEGLEGHHACVVGVDQGHDASKLHLTLSDRGGLNQSSSSEWTIITVIREWR